MYQSVYVFIFILIASHIPDSIKDLPSQLMSIDRTGFFKTLAKSIHSERQAAIAHQTARDTAAGEVFALRRRLMRLKKYEELAPNGDNSLERTRHSAARTLDARCAYRYVQDLVSPLGTLSVPIQCETV